jgi:hypothetical protein
MGKAVFQANLDAQVVRLDHFIWLLKRISDETAIPREASVHRTLLHASVMKVISSGEAVRLLSTAGNVEEILSIGRTMVEVTVNAAYLQQASEKEVVSFLRFHPEATPTRALTAGTNRQGQNGILDRLSKTLSRHLPTPASRQADPVWSRMSLQDRAQIADDAGDIPVMNLLVKRCYVRGHAAVHGTMGSLDYFISVLDTREAARPESRMIALTNALFTVNLCLFTFAFYLGEFFSLNLDRALEQAANAESFDPHMDINIAPRLGG